MIIKGLLDYGRIVCPTVFLPWCRSAPLLIRKPDFELVSHENDRAEVSLQLPSEKERSKGFKDLDSDRLWTDLTQGP